jgi:hypothetical protein
MLSSIFRAELLELDRHAKLDPNVNILKEPFNTIDRSILNMELELCVMDA